MTNSNYDHINEYLDERINNDKEARELVSDFALLWNQYERTLFNSNHHLKDLRETLDFFNISINVDELFYRFKEYLKKRKISYTPYELNEAYRIELKGEYYEKFARMIYTDCPEDRLYILLIIAARVRNNMFHGTKGPWELPKQKELFRICNEVLMKVLEATNNLYT